MTKLCTCCGRQKRGNESVHVITFDQSVVLKVHRSFFRCPDTMGRSFNVKFTTMQSQQDFPINIVVKWSREEHQCDPMDHFLPTLDACDQTSKVIAAFLGTVDTHGWDIKVTKPILLQRKQTMLSVEPFVENALHFEVISEVAPFFLSESAMILSAMSHFSFVYSKGRFVVNNLKGGIDEESLTITLLSPTMLSDRKGQFGCEDLGSMQKYFFCDHVCNYLCRGMKRPTKSSSGDDDDSGLSEGSEDSEESDDSESSEITFTPIELDE